MKKKLLLLGLVGLTISSTIVSCAKDDDDFGFEQSQKSTVNLTFSGTEISNYKSLEVEILENNTGSLVKKLVENNNILSLELAYGSYKITVNGSVVTASGETVDVAATVNADIKTASSALSIPLLVKQFGDDFIIEEVFYTGVKTPEGKNYNSSRYFKLVNNTDKILYADGLIIGQSEFLTSVNNNVTPYTPNEKFAIKGMMQLPGDGTKYQVNPGDFIVIADNAINHNAQTSTAFNLQNADFEFPSIKNTTLAQVDNPAVPNVKVIYTSMAFDDMIFLHSSGVESYVIARFPTGENAENFLQNHKYTYSYTNAAGNITNKSAYAIPNSWIVDGFNNSVVDKFQHILTSTTIDSG